MILIYKLLNRTCVFLLVLNLSCHFAVTADDNRISTDERKTVLLPVIMYHDIMDSSVRRDIYSISPGAFETDIKWLHDNGYQSVGIKNIIDYVENGVKLPDKPIMLTFDDGHYNNICYAEPVLEKYGMKGVIFITGEFCDKSVKEKAKNPAYSYIFWDEQRRMADSGIWEIENHTYNLHRIGKGRNGIAKFSGESDGAYRVRLREDFQILTEKIYKSSGIRPRAFAYPFGVISKIAEDVLTELGYKATFTSYEGITELQVGNSESLRLIRRYLRAPKNPVSEILKKHAIL